METLALLINALVTGANAYGRSSDDPLQQLHRSYYRLLLRNLCRSGTNGKQVVHLMQGYMRSGTLNKSEVETALLCARAHLQSALLWAAICIVRHDMYTSNIR
jgi:hypothetical protein